MMNTVKYLFFFVCLTMSATGMLAQNKVGETCETNLKNTQAQLRKEKTIRQETEKVLNSTKDTLQETRTILWNTETRLTQAQAELKKEKETFNNFKTESESQLKAEKDARKKMETELSTTKQKLSDTETKNTELKSTLSKAQNVYPIIITKIELGNTDYNGNILTNYGNTLYSSSMRYLTTKIYYICLLDQSKQINIKIKIFNPDGSLKYSSSISTKYTRDTDVTVYQIGSEAYLGGFGNSEQSTYSSGTYRIEIWYNDVCLGQKSFYIN